MRKIFVFAIVILFVSILILGCEEQQTAGAGDKRSRLVGVENLQLKKDLNSCNARIEKCQKQLEKCRIDKEIELKKTEENSLSLTKFMMEENKKLSEENDKLKTRLKSLEK